jgi:small subunit ribosomal protein S17
MVKKMKKRKNNIGVGAKEPKDSCDNVRCPWHGSLKIRGRTFQGSVVSSRSTDTAIVTWNYYRHVPKYERHERRKTRIAAHNPKCISAQIGDIVRIGECRPVSKTKKFVVFEVIK